MREGLVEFGEVPQNLLAREIPYSGRAACVRLRRGEEGEEGVEGRVLFGIDELSCRYFLC